MIVATAGHVDHGKTALIRALTGQHTDRTAEELRRGMSIELGYAYLPGDAGQSIDFVDVPGHEKFMRTLLAGVGCVDALMLVVAADDGVMPQTLEHMALIRLLGIQRVVVVISKCSLATPERREQVEQDVLTLLHGQGCPTPARFCVDNLDGTGLDALREQLQHWAATTPPHDSAGLQRLFIDRYFHQPGLGAIVTGTLLSGRMVPGDSLQLSDSGAVVRVRGIQVHHQPVQQALAGQRCALNLSGDLAGAAIGRGSQLLARGTRTPTGRFDARIALQNQQLRGPVQLHIGSAVVNARLVPLKGVPASDGTTYGQWILDTPLCCYYGDRFIIRDPAAHRLLGSGVVVDPFAPQRGRQKPERLRAVSAMDQEDNARALATLLDVLPDGVDLQRFMHSRRIARLPAIDSDTLQIGDWLCRRSRLDALTRQLMTAVDQFHQSHPERLGPARSGLARHLGLGTDSRLLAAALRRSLDQGLLKQTGPCLHLPTHQPRPDTQRLDWLNRVQPYFTACSPRPPVIGELVSELEVEKSELLTWLDRLSVAGLLVSVSRNRYLLPTAADELLESARQLAAEKADGRFSTAEFRDHTGIGRNHSVALLEYFDRAGLTRQVGGLRVVV